MPEVIVPETVEVNSATPPPAQESKSNTKAARTARALQKIAEAHVEANDTVSTEEAPQGEATSTVAPSITKTETAEAPSASKKILELKAREDALNKREKELEKKAAETEAREAGISPKEAAVRALKENPLEALQAAGMSFQDLADAVIADTKIPPAVKSIIKAQSEKLSNLEKTLEEQKSERQKAEEAEKRAKTEATISNFKSDVRKFVESKHDDYELINLTNNQDLVIEVIETHFAEHGEIPPIADAAAAVEKYIEDNWKKLQKAKKFAPPAPVEVPEPSRRTTTLTNSMSSGTPGRTDKNIPMTQQERFKRAAAKIKFDS